MAHFIACREAANYISVSPCGSVTVELWGGDSLSVALTQCGIASVTEVPICTRANIRTFQVTGLCPGTTRLEARLGAHGPAWAIARIVVGECESRHLYYHGTSLANARQLLDIDLEVRAWPVSRLDWTDYTDFGKGFYVHKEENKKLAFDWAKRNNEEWGVVEFCLLASEVESIRRKMLLFQNKQDRPQNSPVLSGGSGGGGFFSPFAHFRAISQPPATALSVAANRASWLEFVEHNRHIEHDGAAICRPNDRDWSGRYSAIIGPIWVPRDSGKPVGGKPFPDHVHQVNWGQAGIKLLNGADAKARRFLYTKDNEALFHITDRAAAAGAR